jgi:hypothetical protein
MLKDNYLRSSVWQWSAAVLLIVVFSPLIVAALLLWVFTRIALSLMVWLVWCMRGKSILFVYSDSPIWRDYIEDNFIPRIRTRSLILNWSDRRHWLKTFSLKSLVFHHFGGRREFNPLAVYFRPFRRHQTFRFHQAFHDWKHGKSATLKQIEEDFFACIGEK